MVERVVPVELGVTWDPNDSSAVLVTGVELDAVLAVRPHLDDPDQRHVALVWEGVRHAVLGGPNDEGIEGHRLCELVRWIESVSAVPVHGSPLSKEPMQHHVLRLKECVVEVVGRRLRVERRVAASTLGAAVAALS